MEEEVGEVEEEVGEMKKIVKGKNMKDMVEEEEVEEGVEDLKKRLARKKKDHPE